MPARPSPDLLTSTRASIWMLRAPSPAGGVTQGSAVAVSRNHLLTACHLLTGVNEAEIVQGTSRHRVSVLLRDQPTDRCVLILPEPALTPIAAVRPFRTIVVGEPVYTIGAPWGHELTLGEGVVSALHPNQGLPIIQMTAPISPGSSGGALVDARGNLLGIVSFRVREDNSMGFALAAESFGGLR